MLTKRKRRILFYGSVAVFLLLLFPVLLYSLSYGISRNLKIQKTGGISIRASQGGAEVITGGKRKNTSLISGGALIKNLLPGKYTVRVKKSDFWEWEKVLEVESEMVTKRDVLLIPKTVEVMASSTTTPQAKIARPPLPSIEKFWRFPNSDDFLILGEDKKFYKNKDRFDVGAEWGGEAERILRTSENSFFDETFSRIIYWGGDKIESYWIENLDKLPQWEKNLKKSVSTDPRHLHIFQAKSKIKSVLQYPYWPDYLLLASGSNIWVLELDRNPSQNMFLVYSGDEPIILSVSNNALYFKDKAEFLETYLP